jgi:hypothetical protein
MTCALILGRAEGVLADAEAIKSMVKVDFLVAVGPVAMDYPGEVDCWVWWHTELFSDRAARRARNGYPPVKAYWGIKYKGRGRDYDKEINVNYYEWNEGGSSGLAAAMIALDVLKADRVALVGIPMDPDGGRYDDHKPWPEAIVQRHSWVKHLSTLQGRVRSYSGWTKELLGGEPPTADWLNEVEAKAA